MVPIDRGMSLPIFYTPMPLRTGTILPTEGVVAYDPFIRPTPPGHYCMPCNGKHYSHSNVPMVLITSNFDIYGLIVPHRYNLYIHCYYTKIRTALMEINPISHPHGDNMSKQCYKMNDNVMRILIGWIVTVIQLRVL